MTWSVSTVPKSAARRASLPPARVPGVQRACELKPLRFPTSPRVSIRTAVSTRGRGEKADRGTTMPRDAEKLVDAQSGLVYLLTTPFCSTRSARRKALRGSSNARNRLEVMPKGGLANTRNGRCGHRNSLASHWTTVTGASAKRRRSSSARVLCSSIARTSAPASTRAAVNAPVPAPISMTSSPRRMPELRTILRAHSASSRCQPHRRPARFPDTTHHREHAHVPTIAAHTALANRFSRRSTRPKARRRWQSALDAGDISPARRTDRQRRGPAEHHDGQPDRGLSHGPPGDDPVPRGARPAGARSTNSA